MGPGLDSSRPQPPDAGPPGLAYTVAAYTVVLVLAVLFAVWGSFLVPLRLGGVPVPLCVVLAVVGNAGLGLAGTRIVGSRLGGLVPGLVWLFITFTFGSQSPGGDTVIRASVMGYAFLVFGIIAATAALGVRPSPGARTGR